MLKQVEDRPSIVVCSTCRVSPDARVDESGKSGGILLAEELRKLDATIAVEEMPCLFNCKRHCSIHLRASGKIGYVLGDFPPSAEAAEAILNFFRLYRDSEIGTVPYSQWPQGVKGHFVVRVPPPGFVSTK